MEKLFKISLILSIAGIMLLLLLSNYLQPELKKIKDINYDLIDKKVKIEGEIFYIRTYKDSNFQVISIKDETGKIDVTTDKLLNLTVNQNIIVIGRISEYKNSLQLTADKIIKE